MWRAGAPREDSRFDIMSGDREEQLAAWWALVHQHAKASIRLAKGSSLFVLEGIHDLALTNRELRFLEVHVVSTAAHSLYEIERTVHLPPLLRLIPVDEISSIAPIVDAEPA